MNGSFGLRPSPSSSASLLALVFYVLLRGLDPTVLKGLQIAGASRLVNGENPISFCNVFFFSQLMVGLAVLLPARQTLLQKLADLSAADRGLLILDAALGLFLGPIAYYLALQSLSVVSQTLLFALVLPLPALLARWLLGEPLPRGFAISIALIAAGLLLPLSVSAAMGGPMDDRVGMAWALAGVAAFSATAVTGRMIAGRGWPVAVSVGLPSAFTAVAFALIALVLFGPHHFLLLQLWWVVGGGCDRPVRRRSRPGPRTLPAPGYRQGSVATVSLWGSLSLPVAVLSAALLLHEALSLQAWLGLALMVAGVFRSGAPAPAGRGGLQGRREPP